MKTCLECAPVHVDITGLEKELCCRKREFRVRATVY